MGHLAPIVPVKGDGVPGVSTQAQVLCPLGGQQETLFLGLNKPLCHSAVWRLPLFWGVTCPWDLQNQLECLCARTLPQPAAPLGTNHGLGLGGTPAHTAPHLCLCTHMVSLWLQAAVKGIDLCALGQSRIDVGQVKPPQRKTHVLS